MVAEQNGNHLRECWTEVLRCVSRFELLQQLTAGVPTDALLFAMPDKAAGNDLLRAGSSWSGWCHGFYLKGGTMLTVTLNGCDRLPIVLFPANAHLHLYQILRC